MIPGHRLSPFIFYYLSHKPRHREWRERVLALYGIFMVQLSSFVPRT